jgi:CHAT domain-containing protein
VEVAVRAVASLLLVLLAGWSFAVAPPARLTPEQTNQLQQRNVLWQQAHKAWQQGKQAEAVADLQRVLTLETRLLGPWHLDVVGTETRLAFWEGQRQRWEQAVAYRRRVHEARQRLDGPGHWRTVEAQWELRTAQSQAGWTEPHRQRWQQAEKDAAELYRLYRAGHRERALGPARQVLDAHKALLGERHPVCARSLNNLASLYHGLGDHNQALPLLQRAVTIYREVGWRKHPAYLATLDNLTVLYQVTGKAREALSLSQEALATRKEELGEQHPDLLATLERLARLHTRLGSYREVLPLRQQILAIHRRTVGEKHLLYAGSLHSLASVYKAQSEYRLAVPLFKQALALRKGLTGEKDPAYASGLDSLAGCYWELGEFGLAHDLCKRALDLRKQTLGEKHPDYAHSLYSLALVHMSMGDYPVALPLARKSVEVYKAVHGEKTLGYCYALHTLAVLHVVRGDRKTGQEQLERVVEVSKAILGEKHPEYLFFLSNLVVVSLDRKAALSMQKKLLEVRKEVLGEKHPDYATTLEHLGGLYREQKQYREAERLYRQALALLGEVNGTRTPHYAGSLYSLAGLYLEQHEPDKARPLVEQALTIKREHWRLAAATESERQQLLGVALLRHYLDLGLTLPDRTPRDVTAIYAHVLAWKGIVFVQQQQRRLFARLLAADPRAEVRRLVGELQQTTRLLAGAARQPAGGKDATAGHTRLEALTHQKEDLESRLSRLSTDFRNGQSRAELTPALLRQGLPEGVALVDFLFYAHFDPSHADPGKRSQKRLSAWVVRRDRPVVRVDLGHAGPIEQAVTAWRQALGRRSAATAAGQTLHKLLWQPLTKHLTGAKTVLLSPDGVLGKVPFAALPGSKEGTYLIEDVAVAVVPVPQLLPEVLTPLPREKRLKPSLLVIGDVNFDTTETAVASADDRSAPRGALQSWGKLEATSAEADAVRGSFSRLFRNGAVTDLREGEARKAAVRQALSKSRYAHLATHGYFAPPELKSVLLDEGRGAAAELFGREGVTGWHPLLLSGLALAGANKEPKPGEEDGILTALEVSEMDLSGLELAVLSACETGLGKQAGGEGLLGLQRAFAVAGCRSVVASLWQVDDRATQALMASFYRVWWGKTPVSRVEALRQAQLSLLKEGVRGMKRTDDLNKKNDRLPPFYWAAFVLSGDWR